MKKAIIIISAVLAGIILYIWQDPQLSKKVLHQTEDLVTPDTTTVYKWTDKNGNPVLSNSPPAGNIPYETIEYHRDTNVMPSNEEKKRKN
ncbi:MAG: DUF4124 domain-containing protein [Gammaproteobacteria bacterium]